MKTKNAIDDYNTTKQCWNLLDKIRAEPATDRTEHWRKWRITALEIAKQDATDITTRRALITLCEQPTAPF